MLDIYVDADGCPVKEEVYRVAARFTLNVFVVCNRAIAVPDGARIQRVRVGSAPDEADDWIAARIGPDDLAVTADIPLAARCAARGARVLTPRGEVFTRDSVGEALAMRDLMADLRDMGSMTGGPPPMSPRDRSRFAARLHETVEALRRARPAPG